METLKAYLVRRGAMGEVTRYSAAFDCEIGGEVVVSIASGETLGKVIARDAHVSPEAESPQIVRTATEADRQQFVERKREANAAFADWQTRIRDWQLNLELIDLEWTLGGERLTLYVLNDRGPETTKLALKAAAAGLGIIEVQPVGAEGLVLDSGSGGGCGSCRH